MTALETVGLFLLNAGLFMGLEGAAKAHHEQRWAAFAMLATIVFHCATAIVALLVKVNW